MRRKFKKKKIMNKNKFLIYFKVILSKNSYTKKQNNKNKFMNKIKTQN